MRIIIISPIPPYRGGISHDASSMAKSLSAKHEVQIVSFSLLYPAILYPGKSQMEILDSKLFTVEKSFFILNSINPFSWSGTAYYIHKQNPNLVIFQWWHPFFSPAYYTILKNLHKRFHILFICHNVLPHEKFPFQKKIISSVLRQADSFIVQSALDEQNLKELVPGALYKRTIHPTYTAFNRYGLNREQARKVIKINHLIPLILFFGLIRDYKGLKHLIKAMPEILKKLPNLRLIIAGEIFGGKENFYNTLISKSGCSNHITMINEYIPDTDVEKYFSACDLVVLPYESATQSGIAQIAFGFDKPVVVTNVGGLPDAVADGKTGYVVPPCDPDAIAKAVIRFFRKNMAEEFAANIRKAAFENSWDYRSQLIEELVGR
jgi:glycosyltransferase involved in cell wall biosynthesis